MSLIALATNHNADVGTSTVKSCDTSGDHFDLRTFNSATEGTAGIMFQ